MQLVTVDQCGGTVGAILSDGSILDLRRFARKETLEQWLPSTMIGLLEGGEPALALVRAMIERAEAGDLAQLSASHAILAADTPLLAPVPEPRLLLAVGLAYKSHLAEMAGTPAPPHPTAFLKSPASIAGPDAPLRLPPQADAHVDFEGELALVFGRHCHNVDAGEALACIAGITVANDFSARDWVKPVWEAKQPWEARLTWEVNVMGKQFPGFTALGPALTLMPGLAGVEDLRLSTRLNGELMQDALISDMIFPLGEVVAHFARWYSFRPGDVILTGTPAGVGIGRKPPRMLGAGDRIEVSIDTVGRLATPVVAA